MTSLQELIEAVHASGATIRIEGSDLKIKPAGVLPPELKARLREHKPDLLAFLSRQSVMSDAQDSWEWIAERAAIMEIEGGLNRNEANHRAFMLWYRRFVEANHR